MNKEQELRVKILEFGIKLVKSGLVQGTWGNISARLDDKRMVCTPSGLDYERLTPADMVVVDLETLEYSGNLKPTSEKNVHSAILRMRPDVNAVIHSHPYNCCVVAAARKEIPVMNDEMQKYVGGSALVAEYALPGFKKIAESAKVALKNRNACFMANHGVLACGASLDIAYETCRVMEECSKKFIEISAMNLKNVKEYNDKLIEDIFLNHTVK
jgi:L-fuculose-phosphate aldolase